MMATEADVVRTFTGSTVTLDELYEACQAAGVTNRNDGDTVIHGRTDTRWRRRLRGVLQTLRRTGNAYALGGRRWVIGPHNNPSETPTVIWLVSATAEYDHVELRLSDAVDLLAGLDEQVDLICADPPWGIGVNATGRADRDTGERVYARNAQHLVGGYQDVPDHLYANFTQTWVRTAAQVLTPNGYLAVITGPARAAAAQVAAETAGLEFVNQIIVPRPFALPTTRRFSHAHTVATVLCRPGPGRRVFTVPAELPKARSGRDYPLDVWADLGKHERRGQVRYPTMLHPAIPRRLITAFTDPTPWKAMVVDPFLGGEETALAAHRLQRRFLGADINPAAIQLTAARLIDEQNPTNTNPIERTAL